MFCNLFLLLMLLAALLICLLYLTKLLRNMYISFLSFKRIYVSWIYIYCKVWYETFSVGPFLIYYVFAQMFMCVNIPDTHEYF